MFGKFDNQEFFIRSGRIPAMMRVLVLIFGIVFLSVSLVSLNNIFVDLYIDPKLDLSPLNIVLGVVFTLSFLVISVVFIYVGVHSENIVVLKPNVMCADLYKNFFIITRKKCFPLNQLKVSKIMDGESEREWLFTLDLPDKTQFEFHSPFVSFGEDQKAKNKSLYSSVVLIFKKSVGSSHKNFNYWNDLEKLYVEYKEFHLENKSRFQSFRDSLEEVIQGKKTQFESEEWFIRLKEVFYN